MTHSNRGNPYKDVFAKLVVLTFLCLQILEIMTYYKFKSSLAHNLHADETDVTKHLRSLEKRWKSKLLKPN